MTDTASLPAGGPTREEIGKIEIRWKRHGESLPFSETAARSKWSEHAAE